MTRRNLIPVFLVLAILAVGYAVYRSAATRITEVAGGRTTVYGEPQHGLLFGLCVFAGLCLVATALLFIERPERGERLDAKQDYQSTTTRKTSTNYPQ
jgi:hypothetical protein